MLAHGRQNCVRRDAWRISDTVVVIESCDGLGWASAPAKTVRPVDFEPLYRWYDALRVLCAQVEAVVSPAAGWLQDVMAFVQAPEELEHRATLEVQQ